MDNPKIRIESDGHFAEVYLDGKKARCTSLDFHGDVNETIHIKWDGIMQKEDGKGEQIIENHEVVTEEFHYDSNEGAIL